MGYAIATLNGKVIRKISDVKIGQDMDVNILDGIINSEIKKIK